LNDPEAVPDPTAIANRRRRARLLGGRFFADTAKHRLHSRGDLVASRDALEQSRFNNLDYLLRTRYEWMKGWIKDGDIVVEIGAGAGFSRRYLNRQVLLTDVVVNRWLDVAMDGVSMALRDASVDVLIISNALHHFASPFAFLREAERVLKEGGRILINEPYCSLLLRLLLRLAQHEGYAYDVDVFDRDAVANDPKDPWSGNNAVSNLLFDSREMFEMHVPRLRIVADMPCESLLFVASGGVTSKLPVPELPTRVLNGIARLDDILVHAAPDLFALSRRTVIEKLGFLPAEPPAPPPR
jgi:SAM-dependent methyltransferase